MLHFTDTLLGNDAGNPISPKCEILADDEPPLNEEDDDDDSEDGDEEPVLDSLILAQFEKVWPSGDLIGIISISENLSQLWVPAGNF